MKRLFILLIVGMVSLSVAQTAFLYIDPETTYAQPGDTFSINFDIADVENLCGWQIYLSWDPSVLHLKRVAEGPFLSENGQKPTFFVTSYDDTANGYMLFGDVLLGQVPPTSGRGTLSYGYFSVKQPGSSPLIYITEGTWRTYLLDPDINEIPFTKQDGFFTTETGITEKVTNAAPCFSKLVTPSVNFLEFDYFVPEPVFVKAALYDISGRMVKTLFEKFEGKGWHKAKVAIGLPYGIYFLRLATRCGEIIKKVVFIYPN